MADPVVIVDAEVLCPVGLTLAESAAAIAAGTTRIVDSSWMDSRFEPRKMSLLPQQHLLPLADALAATPLPTRHERMLRMAGEPLSLLLDSLPPDEPIPPLFVAIPEHQSHIPLSVPQFCEDLFVQAAIESRPTAPATAFAGRAGGIAALQAAVQSIAAGRTRAAIVGAVDTHVDLHLLARLEIDQRLKTATVADGMIPGEAAVFILLAASQQAAQWGREPMARVLAAETGSEPGHRYSTEVYRGEALSQILQLAIAAAGDSVPISDVYNTFNGERYWGKEFSIAMLRAAEALHPEWQVHHAADCIGDPGAAAGCLAVALAADRLRRRHQSGLVLVCASSDYAGRGVAVLAK